MSGGVIIAIVIFLAVLYVGNVINAAIRRGRRSYMKSVREDQEWRDFKSGKQGK